MNRIDEQAIAWVVREDARPLTSDEQARLDAWLQSDPRHRGAHVRARAMFLDLDRVQGLPASQAPGEKDAVARRARRRFLVGTALAATMATGLLGGTAWWWLAQDLHQTRLGEVLRLPLPDGSTMTLNSDSEARVRFDHRHRTIELVRGEALFDVARDASRPFVVGSGKARVVAVGTSFTVQRGADDVLQVVVREGAVDVDASATGSARAPVRLAANFAARAQPGSAIDIEPVAADEVARRLAWLDGMIAFNGDTLAEAASQFARYSRVRILVDDPAVAGRRVVGLYSATDPIGFAEAVASSLGLQVERDGNEVHLRQHAAPAPEDGGNRSAVHREH